MSNLLDFFADWAKQKRRWPLLLLLAIPVIFKLVQSYFGTTFQTTARHPAFIWPSAGIVLAAFAVYFFLTYSERILFSPLADWIQRRFQKNNIRVLVSDSVAWHVLTEKTVEGVTSFTLARLLADVARGFGVQAVVVRESSLARLRDDEQDGLVLGGKSQPFNLLLKVTLMVNEARAKRLVQEIRKAMEFPKTDDENILLLIPPGHFLRSRFLYSHFSSESPLGIDVHGERQVTATRMVLRCALATAFSYDDNPAAGKLFRDVVYDAKLLSSMLSVSLGNVLTTAAYYFILRETDTRAAIEALGLVHQFAPSDIWIQIARAYLLLAAGRQHEASEMIEHATPDFERVAAFQELRGEYLRNVGRTDEAIEAYSKASALNSDPDEAADIHSAIAIVYGMSGHLDSRERSDQMIAHLEEAIKQQPDKPILHIMQGFAWALQGNSVLSERAFKRAEDLTKSDSDQNLLEYWRGRSYLGLGKYEDTLRDIEKRVGDFDKVHDPSILLIIAESLINMDGREAEAEKYVDRILAAGDPDEGRVFRYKGLAVISRMQAVDIKDARERLRLNEEARRYLLRSTATDDENSRTHVLLAALYGDAGDLVNAVKHARRGVELDPHNPDPKLLLTDLASRSGQLNEAFKMLAEARILRPNDATLEFYEGLTRQRAGQLEAARDAYKKVLFLDPQSGAANTNLALVLFDLGEIEESLAHWNLALDIDPESAEAFAGKAIVLASKGEMDAALKGYGTAARRDPIFLNSAKMQNDYFWSSNASKAAEQLISQLPHA